MYHYDVIIIGAGPIGLCLARSLSLLPLSVAIIDKQDVSALAKPAIDGRDIAITHASRHILYNLGVWQHINPEEISIINEARVFNGEAKNFMGWESPQGKELGFIVSNHLIRAACYQTIDQHPSITLLDNVSLAQINRQANAVVATLTNGKTLTAQLLVAADSRFSETRKKIGIPAAMHDFGKTMIICQMQHELAHHGIANECFLDEHTLAILPLNGQRSSVVLTVTPLQATAMLQQDPATFGAWISQQFQHRLGAMTLYSERHAYPLVGVYAQQFVAQRFALLGDAAVGMHPVTAHGFNFGLQGQHRLHMAISSALQHHEDIGSIKVLSHYQQRHRQATLPLYLATNAIVRLYTNNKPPARIARKILLRTGQHLRPLKSLMMQKLVSDRIAI